MHQHSTHGHGTTGKPLLMALLVTLGFAVVEAVAGWWSGSLALLGDAGHMVTDSTALALAAIAAWISKRSPSRRHSYGFGRVEVIAALINALLMLAVVTAIIVEAVERLSAPRQVAGGAVMVVAGIGLLSNLLVFYLLSRDKQNLNIRAALLHVVGDLLGSIAALISGVVIFFTGWLTIDPVLSLAICVLILISTIQLLRDAVLVIMEGVPLHLDLAEVGQAIAESDGRVNSVHDLHIWHLSADVIALSAHVMVHDLSQWDEVLSILQAMLRERFGIEHVTIQPELSTNIIKPLEYTRC